jgi:hypothetical protein
LAIKGRKIVPIVVVLCPKLLDNSGMKTRFGLPRLAGWTGRCGVALVALAFCASALADPSKNVVATPREQANKLQAATTQRLSKKQIYMMISTSAIPQPIDRVSGPIATTATPMYVIGNHAGE